MPDQKLPLELKQKLARVHRALLATSARANLLSPYSVRELEEGTQAVINWLRAYARTRNPEGADLIGLVLDEVQEAAARALLEQTPFAEQLSRHAETLRAAARQGVEDGRLDNAHATAIESHLEDLLARAGDRQGTHEELFRSALAVEMALEQQLEDARETRSRLRGRDLRG